MFPFCVHQYFDFYYTMINYLVLLATLPYLLPAPSTRAPAVLLALSLLPAVFMDAETLGASRSGSKVRY
jgi:hypothetical protein